MERLTTMLKCIFCNIGKSSTFSLSLDQNSLEFGAKKFGRKLDNITSGEVYNCNQPYRSLSGLSEQEISSLIEHALSAFEQVVIMARAGEPLWILDLRPNKLKLNEHEYFKIFQKGFTQKPVGFISEASRECAIVMMSPLEIVDIFMELVCFQCIP